MATTWHDAAGHWPSVPVGVPVPGSPTQQSFQLGSGGTAIVDTANGQFRIVTVTPAPGWIIDRAEQDDPTSIEIRLESGSGEVRFEASLVRGVIVVSFRADDDATRHHDGEHGLHAEHDARDRVRRARRCDDDNSGPGGGDDDNSGSGSSGSGSSGERQ